MRVLNNYGFTFIEILISIFILSFILLGFNGIMLFSLRHTRAAHDMTLGIQQITSMAERLKALGDYEGFQEQINIWNLQNKQLLPKGIGSVSGSYPSYRIMLSWEKVQHPLEFSVIV